jgi:hypothetical protein
VEDRRPVSKNESTLIDKGAIPALGLSNYYKATELLKTSHGAAEKKKQVHHAQS